jgi:hypothetical protein
MQPGMQVGPMAAVMRASTPPYGPVLGARTGPVRVRTERRRRLLAAAAAVLALAILGLCGPTARAAEGQAPALPWWKGVTHAHSRWSDGADFPEMVADWYKSHGYNFLVTTDHDTLQEGERWSPLVNQPRDRVRLQEYQKWLGGQEVPLREQTDAKTGKPVQAARLRALADYRARFEEPGRFILIPGEEISDACGKVQVHVVAVNLAEKILPLKGPSIPETLARHFTAVAQQAQRLKQPMLAILAHPNWGGVVPVEDWQAAPDLRFFEVMNSVITSSDNTGDGKRLSTDRLWDVALSARLSRLGLGPVYGIAADDVHDVQPKGGAGWIGVRSKELTPAGLVAAMNAGEFYASTGVRLKDVRRNAREYAIEVDPDPGVTYTIQFIGTFPGYDRSTEDAKDGKGALLPPTQRYAEDIGRVLKEVKGAKAAYTPTGKELYVRAKVIASKPGAGPDPNGRVKVAAEVAWTQPVVIAAPGK